MMLQRQTQLLTLQSAAHKGVEGSHGARSEQGGKEGGEDDAVDDGAVQQAVAGPW